jgi:pimeloyl-ACP methyl ester carboxylesterase
MKRLLRFVAACALLLALAIGARRLFETPAAIPPPAPGEKDTVVDGVRWRSREVEGLGDVTVVFVHGLMASSASWSKVLASASGGRPAIAVDLPGFGYSARPWPRDYTYGGQAAALLAFLDRRKIGRTALVGNSLGGATAVAVAAARPSRVAALVLVDTPSSSWEIPWHQRLLRAPVVGELAGEVACRPLFAWGLRHVLFARGNRVAEETVDLYWRPVTVPGTRRAALAAARSTIAGFDRLEAAVRAPTLVLWGREDRLIAAETGLRLSERIPGARLVVLPDAGHMPQEEAPEAFSREVAGFLDAGPSVRSPERRGEAPPEAFSRARARATYRTARARIRLKGKKKGRSSGKRANRFSR